MPAVEFRICVEPPLLAGPEENWPSLQGQQWCALLGAATRPRVLRTIRVLDLHCKSTTLAQVRAPVAVDMGQFWL